MIDRNTFVEVLALIVLCAACKGPQGLVGPEGRDAQELLSDPSIQPKVIYTYPPANSLGPYAELDLSDWIQIRFNKYMDPTTVRHAVKLSSPTTTVRIDTGSIYFIGADLYFARALDSTRYGIESHIWKVGETYSLSVTSSARDINGNSLVPAYSMTFAPEPYFRITNISPGNGATIDQTTCDLYVYFNGPVDTSIFSAIQLTPPSRGRWRIWYDSTMIQYYTSLSFNTTYTITVGTSAHDKYGHHLPQPYTSTFATTPFRVSTTSPLDGSTDVSLYDGVGVAFTGSIDTGSVRSAFRITPAIAGSFLVISYSNPTWFSYSPNNGFSGSTTYTVTLDTSMRSTSGVKLSAPYTFTFTTAPLRITSTYPNNGDIFVPRSLLNVNVYFNANLDTGSVRAAFSMMDSSGARVDGNLWTWIGNSYFVFNPSNLPLNANERYTVTISTALKSKSGDHLSAPYTFSFTTGDY